MAGTFTSRSWMSASHRAMVTPRWPSSPRTLRRTKGRSHCAVETRASISIAAVSSDVERSVSSSKVCALLDGRDGASVRRASRGSADEARGTRAALLAGAAGVRFARHLRVAHGGDRGGPIRGLTLRRGGLQRVSACRKRTPLASPEQGSADPCLDLGAQSPFWLRHHEGRAQVRVLGASQKGLVVRSSTDPNKETEVRCDEVQGMTCAAAADSKDSCDDPIPWETRRETPLLVEPDPEHAASLAMLPRNSQGFVVLGKTRGSLSR